MKNYDRINAPAPQDIDRKHAHIIGGGIAGLSVAISLVADAHMPAASPTLRASCTPSTMSTTRSSIGQFVELPLDVVFTVETSVRTALMAVWGLTGLQRPMVPVYEPTYDVRVIVGNLKASLGIKEFTLSALPRILRSGPSASLVFRRLETIPKPQY